MSITWALVAVGACAEDEVPLFYESYDGRGVHDACWERVAEMVEGMELDSCLGRDCDAP